MDIDRRDLAEMAALAFADDTRDDIPDKIWVDSYGGTMFVRAAWASGLTGKRVEQLERLRGLLAHGYRVHVVAVAYWNDHAWGEIDRWSRDLQAVL